MKRLKQPEAENWLLRGAVAVVVVVVVGTQLRSKCDFYCLGMLPSGSAGSSSKGTADHDIQAAALEEAHR